MGSRVFLDANVLLDLTLERGPSANRNDLYQRILRGSVQAYISPSVLHIAAYWLKKSHGVEGTKSILRAFLKDVRVLYMNHEISLLALHSDLFDVEDALQYFTALHHKIEIFVSQDRKLKKSARASLPVLNLEEFANR